MTARWSVGTTDQFDREFKKPLTLCGRRADAYPGSPNAASVQSSRGSSVLKKQRMFSAIVVSALSVGLGLFGTPAADASAVPESAPSVGSHVKVGMTAPNVVSVSSTRAGSSISFDNGATVVLKPAEYKRWLGSPQAQSWRGSAGVHVTPDGITTGVGKCGTATINVAATSRSDALIKTDFRVNVAATDFEWRVWIMDSVGVSDREWGGYLALRTRWDGSSTFHSTGHGTATFWVDNAYSYADTLLGLCFPVDGVRTTVNLPG